MEVLNELKMLIQINIVYTGYGIGFDSRSEFSLPDGSMGKNVIIFGADRSSSVHIDNKKKRYLNQGSDDTTLTAEVKYLIDFLR